MGLMSLCSCGGKRNRKRQTKHKEFNKDDGILMNKNITIPGISSMEAEVKMDDPLHIFGKQESELSIERNNDPCVITENDICDNAPLHDQRKNEDDIKEYSGETQLQNSLSDTELNLDIIKSINLLSDKKDKGIINNSIQIELLFVQEIERILNRCENEISILNDSELEQIQDTYDILANVMISNDNVDDDVVIRINQDDTRSLLEAFEMLKMNISIQKHLRENNSVKGYTDSDVDHVRSILTGNGDLADQEHMIGSLKTLVVGGLEQSASKEEVHRLIEVIEKMEENEGDFVNDMNYEEMEVINAILEAISDKGDLTSNSDEEYDGLEKSELVNIELTVESGKDYQDCNVTEDSEIVIETDRGINH